MPRISPDSVRLPTNDSDNENVRRSNDIGPPRDGPKPTLATDLAQANTGTTAPAPTPSQGQGWVQWTDRGKMYLSRHEKNVFILEGTTNAGFAACKYTGNERESGLLANGEWSFHCELKASGLGISGGQGGLEEGGGSTSSSHPQGDIYVLVDAVEASDLSSGCDFLAIKLSFGSRELRVENRRKTNVQTIFSIPNVLMLRPGK